MTNTNPTIPSTEKISFNSPSNVSNDAVVTHGALVGDLLEESDNEYDTVTTVSYNSDWSGHDSTDRNDAIEEISRKLDLLEKDLNEFQERKQPISTTTTTTTTTTTRRRRKRTEKQEQLLQKPVPSSPTVQGNEDYDFLIQSMFDYINRPNPNSTYNQDVAAKPRQEQDLYLDYILNQGQDDEESIIDISNI